MRRGYSAAPAVNPTINPVPQMLQSPNILYATGCLPDVMHGGIGNALIVVLAPPANLEQERCLCVKAAASHSASHVTLGWMACPRCQIRFSDDDYTQDMVSCDNCDNWTHYACTGFTKEQCATLNDVEVKFYCCQCEAGGNFQYDAACGLPDQCSGCVDGIAENFLLPTKLHVDLNNLSPTVFRHQKCLKRNDAGSTLSKSALWHRHGSLSVFVPMIVDERVLYIVIGGWHPEKPRQRTRFLFRFLFDNLWNAEDVRVSLGETAVTAKTIAAAYKLLTRSTPTSFERIVRIFNVFKERLKLLYPVSPDRPLIEKSLTLLKPPPLENEVKSIRDDCARLQKYTKKWKKPVVVELQMSLAEQKIVDKIVAINRDKLQPHPHRHLHVKRSHIAGFGLFTSQTIPAGTRILEYCGELIGQLVADRRELLYGLLPLRRHDFYFFRLSDDRIIDATLRANAARFVNHSCAPNCESKVMGGNRIVILALRDIKTGEELAYDYMLSREEKEDVVPCYCGASTCRKFMN